MLSAWAFVITLTIPSWGCEPCELVWRAPTEAACWKVQGIMVKELEGYRARYGLRSCQVEEPRAPQGGQP